MDETQGSLGQELEEALAQMERGLGQAADAARRLQMIAPQIASLEGVLTAVQTALATGVAAAPITAAPVTAAPIPATPVPDAAAPTEMPPEAGTDTDTEWSTPENDASPPFADSPGEPAAEGPAGGRCYLLSVESVGGSLDLRTVDQPIAEDPNVLDVALLDYDGRRATLKVWLSEDGDPAVIRDELESRLRSGSGWCVISLTEQVAA